MKRIVSFLLCAFCLCACSSNEDPDCCVVVDIEILIKYVNVDGDNLLDIGDEIIEPYINLYYKVDGEWVKYYDANMDRSKGIELINTDNGTYLSVFPGIETDENNCSETKIEFSEGDFDVIKTEIDRSGSNIIVTKVWYNEELAWEIGTKTGREIEVVR